MTFPCRVPHCAETAVVMIGGVTLCLTHFRQLEDEFKNDGLSVRDFSGDILRYLESLSPRPA